MVMVIKYKQPGSGQYCFFAQVILIDVPTGQKESPNALGEIVDCSTCFLKYGLAPE
jgi:hypothetical protein